MKKKRLIERLKKERLITFIVWIILCIVFFVQFEKCRQKLLNPDIIKVESTRELRDKEEFPTISMCFVSRKRAVKSLVGVFQGMLDIQKYIPYAEYRQ